MTNTKHTVFFPGLNSLRFFAAFAVVLTHIEFTKKLLGHGEGLWLDMHHRGVQIPLLSCIKGEIRWLSPALSMLGELGVVFFFVLSGFLITFLLLREKEVHQKVAIGKFYVRRLLRIWPLYLLVVVLGFFVLPYIHAAEIYQQQRYMWYGYYAQLALYLAMLPNLSFAYFNIAIPNIGQAWSIGVEEQFYLIWPWIIGKSKNVARSIGIFVLILMGTKVGVATLPDHAIEGLDVLKRFLGMTKMECMAIGAFGAFVVHSNKQSILKWVYALPIQWVALGGIFPLLYLLPVAVWPMLHLVMSLLFLIIIINVSTNPHSVVSLNYPWMDFLGRISFGIYMYHMMVITLVLYAVKGHITGYQMLSAGENIAVYTLSILLTIVVAHLSYRYFERPWMRMKDKFATIVSGDEARKIQGGGHV